MKINANAARGSIGGSVAIVASLRRERNRFRRSAIGNAIGRSSIRAVMNLVTTMRSDYNDYNCRGRSISRESDFGSSADRFAGVLTNRPRFRVRNGAIYVQSEKERRAR